MEESRQRLKSPCPPLRFIQLPCSSAEFFYTGECDEQESKTSSGNEEMSMLCFASALFLLLAPC